MRYEIGSAGNISYLVSSILYPFHKLGFHFSESLESRKIDLPQGLVDQDSRAVAQIQAPGRADHGKADASVPIFLAESQTRNR